MPPPFHLYETSSKTPIQNWASMTLSQAKYKKEDLGGGGMQSGLDFCSKRKQGKAT